MYNILKLNSIAPLVNDILADGHALSDKCDNPDAVIVRSFVMHDYAVPASLLAVARAGAGFNNIPFEEYAKKGIVVFNTPGANANAVKELVIASLFLASRNLKPAMAWADSLAGTEGVAAAVEKGKSKFVGPEILGKTIGLAGLGAIGRLVADAAVALGMKVVGFDPYLPESILASLKGKVEIVNSLDKLYAVSDYISLHMPLTAETTGLIDAAAINKMKDGAFIINCARAKLAVSADIKAALKSGKLSAYVTDFPDESTVGVDGIIAIPHLGASSPEAEDNCAIMAANQIKDYLENGNIKNSVNLPNIEKVRTAKSRLSIISTADVSEKINVLNDAKIKDLKSASNGTYFSLIADFDGDVDLAKIAALPEVLKARIV